MASKERSNLSTYGTLILMLVGATGLGASWWTKTLSPLGENALALIGFMVGILGGAAEWLVKKETVQDGASRYVKRALRHGAVRGATALLSLGAAVVFWNDTRHGCYVFLVCEAPLAPGLMVRAGDRNLTSDCNGEGVWIDDRVAIEATAPDHVRRSFASIDRVPHHDRRRFVKLEPVERKLWRCIVKQRLPADPRRCTETTAGAWQQGAAFRLSLLGASDAPASELKFSLESADPLKYGVGVAGIGGCVVAPVERDSPRVQLETTPDCVKLSNDGTKELELTTFVCANAAAPPSLHGSAHLFAQWNGSGAELEIPCAD